MPYFLKGNCVHKGTEEEPGEVVKCHDDHAAAVAHIRALYANVEDAEEKAAWDAEIAKGGSGSGWHKPPRGTHDAEHAPNFAGGPGADRKYGTESDEPPKGAKRCKCSKCGAVIVLPKGKQCEDIKCPACGNGSTQEVPREDKPAEGESGRNPKPGREKQETHACTCSECDKTVHVPLGQKCNEVPCPECKEMMKQGEEEKAIVGDLGPTMHGQGGAMGEVSAVMDDGESRDGCKCPKCGRSIPCTAKACPYCKENIKPERSQMDEEEKAEWSAASVNNLPDSAFLYVESGEKDDEGKTTPRSKRHLPYKNASGEVDLPHLRNAISRLGQPATGKGWMSEDLRKRLLSKARGILKKHGGGGEEKAFTIYKSSTGDWRWMTLSSWAVVDKEREVVSEQAYRDAIAYAQKANDWGQLDLIHINGTDVGDCDQLFILKNSDQPAKFGAGGTWYDTAKATRAREAIQADPEHWGVSLKFRFNPQRFVRGIYTGDIQVLKHSILPQDMAASYGTAIAVAQGGKQMKALDEKAAEALRQLGHTEDEIAELAEKQKALPDEENVVEKEDTTQTEASPTEASAERSTIWKKLGEMIGIKEDTPDEASKPDEARKAEVEEPAITAEPAEKQAEGETPEAEKADEPDASALLPILGEAIAKSVGEMVRTELDVRDKRIEELEKQIAGLNESVEEKVEQRLRDLPQVVKVAASQVEATAIQEKPKGLTFGRRPEEADEFATALLEGIKQVVQDKTGAQFKV